MKGLSTIRSCFLVLVTALAATACSEADPIEPADSAPQFSSLGPVLVECPTDVTHSASGTIDASGGSIEVAGTRITVPALAVTLPTQLTLTVPASTYMEIDIRANGADHFDFAKPVSVTIDYSRCTRSNIDKADLTVWYIDSSTKALLQNMGGVDDKVARTITFGTDHLSGFSIAE